ncbi:MAG: thiamine phosphate synthase [Candidatus Acidoferrales bacterium]|nr:thiamine phosphate synthase [Candidatus Acidoferrales bacterium]
MFPSLYAILDPDLASTPLTLLAETLSGAGVQLMQLRDKRGAAAHVYSQAKELAAILSPRGVRLIVNDRPDIAAMTDSAGVHVGQEDLPVEDARRVCGPSRWVGISTHNLAQLRAADATSADYIAVGPIFPTSTKANPDPVVGIDFLRAARQLTRKPLVAIGGITIESAADVFRAGADSVAIIRDLLAAPGPGERAQEYLAIAERSRAHHG